MVKAVALTCNNCGGLFDAPEEIRFLTCEHCGARLSIERSDGAAYTKVLEAVARIEEQAIATSANVEVIQFERQLEKIDAARSALDDPGGNGVTIMCGCIAFVGLILAFSGSVEAQAAGILNVLIFGILTLVFAVNIPRRRLEYDRRKAELDHDRVRCVRQLEAARVRR